MLEKQDELARIYNSWQRTVFGKCGKPFKYRRDFSDFDKSHPSEYASLLKLRSVFSSFPSINPDNYFVAPYEIMEDEYKDSVLRLDFFCTPKAVRLYKEYISLLDEKADGPDDISSYDVQKNFIGQMSFVRDYCIENRIDLVDYVEKDVGTPEILFHFIQRKVGKWVLASFYLLGARFDRRLKKIYSDDELSLMYGRQSIDAWLKGITLGIPKECEDFMKASCEIVRRRVSASKKTD